MKIHFKTLIQKSTMIATVLSVGLLGVSTAMAGTIASCATETDPGNTVFTPDCTGSTSGTLVASMVAPFSYTTTAGTNTGTVDSAVYNDGGTFDFYYQVENDPTSATALARMTATNFVNFITGTAFITNGSTLTGSPFVDGNTQPQTSDSNTQGSVIGFSFFPPTAPPTEIGPGQTSYVLIITTNATSWTAGNASVIDGGTATVAAFQPGTGVPEPASFALLGLGLVGLAGFRRRFSR